MQFLFFSSVIRVKNAPVRMTVKDGKRCNCKTKYPLTQGASRAYTEHMLQGRGARKPRSASIIGCCALFALSLFFTVLPVSTAEAAVETCEVPTVHSFTPYVYEGRLDSFDFRVTGDQRHFPFAVSIGGEAVPLHYVSIWDTTGSRETKIHVDVPDPYQSGNVPIQVGLIQITDGPPPTCITPASFSVAMPTQPTEIPPTVPPTTGEPATPTEPEEPTQPEEPSNGGVSEEPGKPGGGAVCTSYAAPIWLGLTALALLVTGAILLFIAILSASPALFAIAVLAPPTLLVGTWFLLETCHNHTWFPVIVLLFAIGVLVGSGFPTFWETQRKRYLGNLRK